jgi:YjbE family integral membrane protein
MTDIVANDAVIALIQVVMINLVLSGDNAVVIGLAAAGLPGKQRKRAITIGILIATALRIAGASVATQLLQVFGLLLAGGILLLWVCWKMWRELQTTPKDQQGGGETLVAYAPGSNRAVGQATLQIVVADFSMSLDNVLAIAGAARDHPLILAFGLLLSIGLMASPPTL